MPLPEETANRVDIALAIPLRDGKIFVARRSSGLHLAGMWEFPGGKIEPDETPEAAARRELREETALLADRLEPLVVCVHDYVEAPLRFHAFLAREPQGEVELDSSRESVWLSWEELSQLPMPDANRQIMSALRWRIGR